MSKNARKSKEKLIGYFFRIAAILIWGITPIVIKYNLSDINPVMVTGISIHFGFLFIVPFYILQKNMKKEKFLSRANGYTKYFWGILLFDASGWIFFILSLHFTTASNPILFLNFAPVLALTITMIFFRNKMSYLRTKFQKLSIFILFATGCFGTSLLIIYNGGSPNFHEKLLGDFYGIIVLIFDVTMTMLLIHYAKSKEAFTGLDFTFRKIVILSVLFAPFVFSNFIFLTPRQIYALLFLGIFDAVLSCYFAYEAYKRIDGLIAYLMFNLTAVVTVLIEVIFFDLAINWQFIAGALLVVVSSIVVEMINTLSEKKTRTS